MNLSKVYIFAGTNYYCNYKMIMLSLENDCFEQRLVTITQNEHGKYGNIISICGCSESCTRREISPELTDILNLQYLPFLTYDYNFQDAT